MSCTAIWVMTCASFFKSPSITFRSSFKSFVLQSLRKTIAYPPKRNRAVCMPMLAIISHAISQPRDQSSQSCTTSQHKADKSSDVLFDHRSDWGAFDHELALGLKGISEFHQFLKLGNDVGIRHYDVGSIWVLHRGLLRVDDVDPSLVAIAGDVVLRGGGQL